MRARVPVQRPPRPQGRFRSLVAAAIVALLVSGAGIGGTTAAFADDGLPESEVAGTTTSEDGAPAESGTPPPAEESAPAPEAEPDPPAEEADESATPPAVIGQPQDATVESGAAAEFTVTVEGVPAPKIQWQRATELYATDPANPAAWEDIPAEDNPSAITATLRLETVTAGQNGAVYRAVASNVAGLIETDPVTLTVTEGAPVAETPEPLGTPTSPFSTLELGTLSEETPVGPVFTVQPADAALTGNESTVTFFACSTGATSATWQWLRPDDADWSNVDPVSTSAAARYRATFAAVGAGSSPCPGVNGAALILRPVRDGIEFPSGTQFRVVVSDAASNTTTSDAMTVTVAGGPEIVFGTSGPYQRGDEVLISGSGFAQNSAIQVGHGTSGASVFSVLNTAAGFTTDSNGEFEDVPITIPVGEQGNHQLSATGLWPLGAQTLYLTAGTLATTPSFTVVEGPSTTAPTVVSDPSDQAEIFVAAGTDLTLTATVSGADDATARWVWKRWPNVDSPSGGEAGVGVRDGDTFSFTIEEIDSTYSGQPWALIVYNSAGLVQTTRVILRVQAPAEVAITQQPSTVTVAPGGTATFTAAATGMNPPTVQWQKLDAEGEWQNVLGATSTTLTVESVPLADSGSTYRAVFTNQLGSRNTSIAQLLVSTTSSAPVVTTHPQDTFAEDGDPVTLSAAASGVPTPSVQWQSKTPTGPWTNIVGATSTNYTIGVVTQEHQGVSYRAVFTNSEGTVQTSAAVLTVGAEPEFRTYTSPDDPTVTYTVPTRIEQGEDIVVSGTGWISNSPGLGSVVAVLLDAGYSGDPNTVRTTRTVLNPVTGLPPNDPRLHAIVQADELGNWTATVPYPTAENSTAGNTTLEWLPGSTHQVRFLTGTLGPSDKVRSIGVNFRIEGDAPEGPTYPPTWEYEQVFVTNEAAGNTAIAWVQKNVEAGAGRTLLVKGTGWVNQAGTGASTVALKLNYDDGQYTHSGSDIVQHPSATGDNTIWVLLAPSNPSGHPNVVTIPADGNFEIEVPLPDGMTAGQMLSVLFQSGRFDSADITRAVTSNFLVVGGVPYEAPPEETDLGTCVPSTPSAQVSLVETNVELGDVLHVSGTGWCHPVEDRGGSLIAIQWHPVHRQGVPRIRG